MARNSGPLALLLLVAACASSAKPAGELVVSAVSVRMAPAAARSAAIYFTVRNRGVAIDTLLGIRTEAGAVTMHETMSANASMTMTPLAAVAIPAAGEMVFAVGGRHGMLEQFARPLRIGDSLSLGFDFARAGHVVVPVVIQPIAGVE